MNRLKQKKLVPLVVTILALVVIVFAVYHVSQGSKIHDQVLAEQARLQELQKEYFTQSKAIRDGAATGSELNETLAAIKNSPSELFRLGFVGLGKILMGIFFLLLGILIVLVVMLYRISRHISSERKKKVAPKRHLQGRPLV